MKFMFDLDETLVTGDVIKAVSSEMMACGWLDRIYSGEDLLDFNLNGIPTILKERVIEAFSDPKYVEIKEPLTEAYCLLNALEKNGHLTGVVTARSQNLKRITIKKLYRDFNPIQFKLGIYLANLSTTVGLDAARPSKIEILQEQCPDYYFDDSIEYCNEAISIGIPNVYLISNRHTGWNKDKSKLNKQIKIIKHVAELDIWSIYS